MLHVFNAVALCVLFVTHQSLSMERQLHQAISHSEVQGIGSQAWQVFDANGAFVATAKNNTVYLWNYSNKLLTRIAHQGLVDKLFLLKENKILTYQSKNKTVSIWNSDGSISSEFQHNFPVLQVKEFLEFLCFNLHRMVDRETGSSYGWRDGTEKVIASSGKCLAEKKSKGVWSIFNQERTGRDVELSDAVIFFENERYILEKNYSSGEWTVFDLLTGKVALIADSRWGLGYKQDRLVGAYRRVEDWLIMVKVGEDLLPMPLEATRSVLDLFFSAHNDCLITTFSDSFAVLLCNTATRSTKEIAVLSNPPYVAWSDDGNYFAFLGDENRNAVVMDRTGKHISSCKIPGQGKPFRIRFGNGSDYVLIETEEETTEEGPNDYYLYSWHIAPHCVADTLQHSTINQ